MLTPREHDFALILGGIEQPDEVIAEALCAAGCDDATLAYQRGVATLDFARTAPTMRVAVMSAIRNVHAAGIGVYVVRVDDCLFVTQAEIAGRSGLTPAAISNYVAGKRGNGDFPPPSCHITDGQPLWHWCEVAYWLRRNGQIGMDALYDSVDMMNINAQLESFWARQAAPDEFASVSAELGELYQGIDSQG